MRNILFIILNLIAVLGYSQSGRIIGATAPRYLNRPIVKSDTTIFVNSNANGDMSLLGDVLGGRSMVTLIVTKNTGVGTNPNLPTITDTLRQTKFRVKVYMQTSSEKVGVFQNDLGFVLGYDGTTYVDNGTVHFIQDAEEYVFTPVEDGNGLHWSTTKTGGADGSVVDSIAKYSLKDYSNVLFVSLEGDDATAVKNKIGQPWLTMAAAVASATSGDLIYVFQGSYTVSTSLWKPGVNWHFEDVVAGSSFVGTEYVNGSSCLFLATSSGTVKVTGNLRTARLIRIDTADVVFDAVGYQLGQVVFGRWSDKS